MKYHENSIGDSSEWYTPATIFEGLKFYFDLDPCAADSPYECVPARVKYFKCDDGMRYAWHGLVFMNPPFGGRNGHVPWLRRFLEHANGIAIVRAYTSSAWFHEHAVKAQTMLFPKGKTKFVRADGSVGKAPGHGIVLLGMGKVANEALQRSNLGFFIRTGS